VSCSLKLSVQIFRATSFSVYFFDCLDLFVCFVFIRNVILISLIVHVCLCFLSFFLSFLLSTLFYPPHHPPRFWLLATPHTCGLTVFFSPRKNHLMQTKKSFVLSLQSPVTLLRKQPFNTVRINQ